LRALALAAFFLSGASSLLFQSVWTRELHHVFGATSVAMSSVLTAFMAGLGLGAHFFGRRRVARPLRAYALCELGVALWALGLPWLLRADGPIALVNLLLREQLGAGSTGFMLARFLCVLPLLIVPTTLMGGTLPFLARHFVRSDGGDESASTGALYAINTLGAVAGTAAGSFLLMPLLGVRATNLTAVAINAALGLTLLAVDRGARPASEASTPSPAQAPLELPAWARTLALAAFALSGAAAMTYEVVWSRALAMAIGSSLQSFALILVTFLMGIALGSAALSRLFQVELRPLSLLWPASAVLSVLALAPAMAFENSALALLAAALLAAGLALVGHLSLRKEREDAALAAELADEPGPRAPAADRSALLLLVPVALAAFELVRFTARHSSLDAAARHGYLPFISAAVVAAIAVFLWLCARLRSEPWLLGCALPLYVAGATLVGYAFQDEIPYTFARLVSSLDDLPSQVPTVRFFMLFTAGLCTLPATLGMGAMFPLTLRLWARGGADVGRDVGTVYAANTLGSIVGAWLPGFVLLPRLGMEATLRAGMLLGTGTSLGLLAAALKLGTPARPRRALGAAALALWALLAWSALVPRSWLAWNLSHMTLGAFRVSLAREVLDKNAWGQPDLLYYRDGVSTTVSVERWGAHLSLKNNGKIDASNGDDMPTQVMVAAYPLLLHPRGPEGLDIAIIGFGSGVTVGAALSFPVKHIDAMELEDAVVEAGTRFFADVSRLPQKLSYFPYVDVPRLTLHADDGRNFLASTKKRYDVIISEPSNPWITGVSDLFTVDHFRISKQRLSPDGVYCQWVQLYEMSPENIKTIYRTFASQFRHVLAFAAEELSSDTVLVGSDVPLSLGLSRLGAVMADPRIAAELARGAVYAPHDVLSRSLFASKDEMLRFTHLEERRKGDTFVAELYSTGATPCELPDCRRKPAPLNSDDNMLIELRAPDDLIGYARYAGYLQLFYGEGWPYGRLAGRVAGLEAPAERVRLALSLLGHGRKGRARELLAGLAARDVPPELATELRTARLLLGEEPPPVPRIEPPLLGPTASRATRRAVVEAQRLAADALEEGKHERALVTLEQLAPALLERSGPGLRLLAGIAQWRAAHGDPSRERAAISALESLARDEEDFASAYPETFYFLALALRDGASFDRAVRTMRRYAALSPTPEASP
jgi:spermidine synthase